MCSFTLNSSLLNANVQTVGENESDDETASMPRDTSWPANNDPNPGEAGATTIDAIKPLTESQRLYTFSQKKLL